MYEEFKGFKVPRPHDDTTYNSVMSQTVDKFNEGEDVGRCSHVYCQGIGCSRCLFRWNGKHGDEVIRAFAEYAHSKGYKITRDGLTTACNSKPELVPGMVIKTVDGSFYLYIGAEKFKAQKIVKTSYGSADFSVIGSRYEDLDESQISSIFYWDDNRAPSRFGKGLSSFNVMAVLRGSITKDGCIKEWKKLAPVKMTVSEIAEKLGYEVEVVADK